MTTRRSLIYTATFWLYERLLRLNLSRKKKRRPVQSPRWREETMVIPRDSRGSVESGARRKNIKKYQPKNATIPAKKRKTTDIGQPALGRTHMVFVSCARLSQLGLGRLPCDHPIGSITREDLLLPFSFFLLPPSLLFTSSSSSLTAFRFISVPQGASLVY